MNQNWIVENLNNAFSTWNGKLGELWGLVTTGPQTFKGGAVWGVMQTLHNGIVGIGYALVVLFFAISLCKNTMNFHELKRPEAAIHYLLRFVAAKAFVGYGMDIMLNVFSICNGIVTDMAASMGGISEAMVSLPAEMQTAIENVGFLASIPLWLVTILGSLFITVLSFVMILTVYGRFFLHRHDRNGHRHVHKPEVEIILVEVGIAHTADRQHTDQQQHQQLVEIGRAHV